MQYKGYIGRVEYDAEGDTFHGEVVDTRDVITFEGRSVEELRQALKDSVDTYLEVCKEAGKSPDRPFSGQFVVRLDPALHREIATMAALSGKSLNAWVVEACRAFAEVSGASGGSGKARKGPRTQRKRQPPPRQGLPA